MCGQCGCEQSTQKNDHANEHTTINIKENILSFNESCAQDNRNYFKKHAYKVFNLMSSPGSGKTTLLQKTIQALSKQYSLGVVVGDQYTELDADALRTQEVTSIQINTNESCHLDAHQILHARDQLNVKTGGIIFIENIGNLVCPAAFDLGENYKVLLLAVTEGEQKPLKYAPMFRHADVLIINKCDLLPYVSFSVENCIENSLKINPKLKIFCISCTNTHESKFSNNRYNELNNWYEWLRNA